jgi:hypothetical protein
MVFYETAGRLPCRFPARRDLDAGLQPPPGTDQPFGEIAACSDQRLEGVRGCREVSAYSTVYPEFAGEVR